MVEWWNGVYCDHSRSLMSLEWTMRSRVTVVPYSQRNIDSFSYELGPEPRSSPEKFMFELWFGTGPRRRKSENMEPVHL
jgi:hypothetical protein